MNKIKFFSDNSDLEGKTVLLRLDLNVPLNKQKITDTNRIDKIIPTLDFLLNNKVLSKSINKLLIV